MEAPELLELLKNESVRRQINAIVKDSVDTSIRDQLTASSLQGVLRDEGVIKSLRGILGEVTKDKNAEVAMHYGNLRFAVYSASIVIIGGMLAMYLNGDYRSTFLSGNVRFYFGWAGVGMAVSLGLAQHRINENLFFYQQKAIESGTIGALEGMKGWKWIARIVMLAPYVAAAICWVLMMYRSELFEKS